VLQSLLRPLVLLVLLLVLVVLLLLLLLLLLQWDRELRPRLAHPCRCRCKVRRTHAEHRSLILVEPRIDMNAYNSYSQRELI